MRKLSKTSKVFAVAAWLFCIIAGGSSVRAEVGVPTVDVRGLALVSDNGKEIADETSDLSPHHASHFYPPDATVAASTPQGSVTLQWSPGDSAQSHDVYFGTSFGKVLRADRNSPEFIGNQPRERTIITLTALRRNKNYYWRIDELNGGSTYKSDVLRFQVSDVWLMRFGSDVGDLEECERICAYALQGLVNRASGRLFIDTKGGNAGNRTADEYWVSYLSEKKDYTFGEVANLRHLIQLAKESGYLQGLVEYNLGVVLKGPGQNPHCPDQPLPPPYSTQLCPALNFASTESRLPVTPDMLSYDTRELANNGNIDCFQGLPILDITNDSHLQTHGDAQKFVVETFLPSSPTTGAAMIHVKFGNMIDDPNNFNTGIDYAVMREFVIFDMNPAGSDEEKNLYNTVMKHLERPAMVFGDWYCEEDDVEAISLSGSYAVLSTVNLSFWANVLADPRKLSLRRPGSNPKLDSSKYYVLFQASDGDSMGYCAGLEPSGWDGHSVWLDPRRGETPIAWTFQPLAGELFPALVEYYRTTATKNDSFCAGPSGAGYCRPSELPNLADFAKHTEKYLKITGIQWVENWWTFNLDMLETYKANAPSVRCFGHQGTQGGRNLWLPDCTPVASADDPPDHKSLWYAQLDPPMDEDPIDGIVARITRFAATKTPPFFITVYDTPKHVMNYAQICKRDLPGNFQIVRLEDFIDLMSQACPFSADEASDTQGDEEEDQAEKQTEDL